jgi:hypothetical protein
VPIDPDDLFAAQDRLNEAVRRMSDLGKAPELLRLTSNLDKLSEQTRLASGLAKMPELMKLASGLRIRPLSEEASRLLESHAAFGNAIVSPLIDPKPNLAEP